LYNYIDNDIKIPWWKWLLKAPFELITRIQSGKDKESPNKLDPYILTKKQELVINSFTERISITVDKRKSVVLAGVTMQDPIIAATVADSLVSKLGKYIITYKTNKARLDYEYANRMFQEAKQRYFESQQNYAQFCDENKNIILKSVLINEERLKNEEMLAYNIYSTLAQQVESSRMRVQEKTPCITIIEPARVPTRKSNMGRLSILLAFFMIGIITGFGYLYFQKLMIERAPNNL